MHHTYNAQLRPVHNMMLYNALHRVTFTLTLVEMQCAARIDLDPTLAFLCVASLHQIVKKMFVFHEINAAHNSSTHVITMKNSFQTIFFLL